MLAATYSEGFREQAADEVLDSRSSVLNTGLIGARRP
jgi:hypothetical protein